MNTKIIFLGLLAILIAGCTPSNNDIQIGSFYEVANADICYKNDKPVVILFSTTWCPHCAWIKETFETTVQDYSDQIEAYNWEIDTGDNALTEKIEEKVPANHKGLFLQYSNGGSVPTFLFGCKYYRIGNGYEGLNNGLELEQKELKSIIEKLISEA